MKIYTRAGDNGSTGLFGGRRVSKADPRIDCCGALDELNAAIGWTACAATDDPLLQQLRTIQHELFNIGSHLATPADQRSGARLPPLPVEAAGRLEREIDSADAGLSPLRNFILPGGSELAARLHLSRTVCRAAERAAVQFHESVEPVDQTVLQFLNRLSDWLFVQARAANRRADVGDVAWLPGDHQQTREI